jgi:predicted translin family RNA/ssDNA-binding protein
MDCKLAVPPLLETRKAPIDRAQGRAVRLAELFHESFDALVVDVHPVFHGLCDVVRNTFREVVRNTLRNVVRDSLLGFSDLLRDHIRQTLRDDVRNLSRELLDLRLHDSAILSSSNGDRNMAKIAYTEMAQALSALEGPSRPRVSVFKHEGHDRLAALAFREVFFVFFVSFVF